MSICAPALKAAAPTVLIVWFRAPSGVGCSFSYSPSSVSFMHSQKDTCNKRRTSLTHPANALNTLVRQHTANHSA